MWAVQFSPFREIAGFPWNLPKICSIQWYFVIFSIISEYFRQMLLTKWISRLTNCWSQYRRDVSVTSFHITHNSQLPICLTHFELAYFQAKTYQFFMKSPWNMTLPSVKFSWNLTFFYKLRWNSAFPAVNWVGPYWFIGQWLTVIHANRQYDGFENFITVLLTVICSVIKTRLV